MFNGQTMRVLVFLGACLLITLAEDGVDVQKPPVVYDVTTIYRLKEPLPESNATLDFSHRAKLNHPGVMEVHARTNARGLPFLLDYETVISPNVGVDLPEYVLTSGTSGYELNNFTVTDINSNLNTPINTQGREYDDEYEFNMNTPQTKLKPCGHRRLQLDLTVTENSQNMGASELLVFLVESRSDVHTDNNMYLLRFTYSGDQCYLYKCTSRLFAGKKNIGGVLFNAQQVPDGCEVLVTPTYPWYFSVGEKISITTEMSGSSLAVTIASPRKASTKVFDWDGLDPLRPIAYFAVGSKLFSGLAIVKSDPKVNTPLLYSTILYSREFQKGLVLNQPTGSLISPPLPPNMDKICVSLIFYADREVNIELYLQQDGAKSLIGRIQGHAVTKGEWTHQIFVADIPGTSNRDSRVVVTVTKPAGATVIIHRLSGCNSADPEDVFEMAEVTVNVTNSGLDVAHNIDYNVSENNACTNGGLQVGWVDDATRESPVCICPAGFTGNKCSEGCGANSYGSDCGGVCSGSERGCRGMVLCRPMMDCDCSPGYKGAYCGKACDSGEYGAGCRQRCGRCLGEPCDMYTGLCHQGCIPGYLPPYCKEPLSYTSSPPQVVVLGFHNVSVSANLNALKGQGAPHFYQLQYKESGTSSWCQEVPQAIPEDKVKSNLAALKLGDVKGLKPGTDYLLRVVLKVENFGSYQGDLVPTAAVSTPCIVPGKVDYANAAASDKYLKTNLVQENGFEVEWKFPSTNVTWCRVIGYEVHVKMDWRWVTHSVGGDVTTRHVTGLLPGWRYPVKVRAVTARGLAALSDPLVVTTLDKAPDHVVNLKVTLASKRALKVTWEPPKHPAGTIRHYHVTYQCLLLEACPEVSCADSAGQVDVTSTSHLIEGLLPFALYNISVAGLSGSLGTSFSVQAATSHSEPDIIPASANPAILARSNSSLTVQWAPPDNCREVNGYLTGYRYELVPSGTSVPLVVGTTTACSASFDNLLPHVEFVIRVYVVTDAGWSISKALEITAHTRATTPKMVQDLVVYKRGRRMLGLRWSPPRITSGSLESFSITHSPVDGSRGPVSVNIAPTACPAWPQLFCHTILNLKQDKDYTIAVKARNSEINDDGEEVVVNATTREGAPGAPTFLRLLNETDVNASIEWGLPDLVNGQLRSFLVNVEETDSYNASECCEYFPIKELIVSNERLNYEFQMTELKPASSYEVSLSAKTIAMGPAVTLTVHTRPATPVLVYAPELAKPAVVGNPLSVRLEPAADYEGELLSGYLLLLKDNSGVQSSSLKDEWLATELKRELNGHFLLVAEFAKDNIPEGGVVEVIPGQPMVDGLFGTVGLRALKPDTQYQLVWAAVLEYCNILNVGLIKGEPFTVKQA